MTNLDKWFVMFVAYTSTQFSICSFLIVRSQDKHSLSQPSVSQQIRIREKMLEFSSTVVV